MKPAPFDYIAPTSLEEAVAVLAANDNAKVIAGGQSLMPMLNFRVVTPDLLVDISRIPDLSGIEQRGRGLSIGALTCHHAVQVSPLVRSHLPVISEAMGHVAHLAIRNRGTIGGSLSHADPAAEWPMLARLLNAQMHLAGPAGHRTQEAQDFFLGALTTALNDAEILTKIDFPALPVRAVHAFDEVSIRTGDYALVAVGIVLSMGGSFLTGGRRLVDARIALMGAAETPLRMHAAEARIVGEQTVEPDLIEGVACVVRDGVQPASDLHASADFRRALAFSLTKRLLAEAWAKLSTQPEV